MRSPNETRAIYVVMLAFLVSGCTSSPQTTLPKETPPTTTADEFLDPPAQFTPAMRKAQKEFTFSTPTATAKLARIAPESDKVIVYQGVPREGSIREQDLVNLHGYPFYAEPLSVGTNDLEAINKIVANPDSFHRFLGEKECGGFHPDYSIEWQAGSERVRLLICYGCGEAKIYAIGIRSRHEMAQKEIKAILKE